MPLMLLSRVCRRNLEIIPTYDFPPAYNAGLITTYLGMKWDLRGGLYGLVWFWGDDGVDLIFLEDSPAGRWLRGCLEEKCGGWAWAYRVGLLRSRAVVFPWSLFYGTPFTLEPWPWHTRRRASSVRGSRQRRSPAFLRCNPSGALYFETR